eukprot:5067460-Amphidinium_carterae.1
MGRKFLYFSRAVFLPQLYGGGGFRKSTHASRNFAEAGLLVQFCEMKRCHVNTFYFPFEPIYPLVRSEAEEAPMN